MSNTTGRIKIYNIWSKLICHQVETSQIREDANMERLHDMLENHE